MDSESTYYDTRHDKTENKTPQILGGCNGVFHFFSMRFSYIGKNFSTRVESPLQENVNILMGSNYISLEQVSESNIIHPPHNDKMTR